QVDPDPWRNRLRHARQQRNPRALAELARDKEVAHLPAASTVLLGSGLRGAGRIAEAIEVLQEAQERYPNDFWINHELGVCLTEVRPPRAAEAVGFLRAALVRRPESPGVYVNLGNALHLVPGKARQAAVAYGRAIELKPDYATAWYNRGNAYSTLHQY